ncbi:hypothetical protein [Psychrobacter sp.]|uniref:hypothetical protein n=1 Tax=Psychrobacter sp. TaxID=56811 RepID=UPI0025DFE634|nr:MULTISPECIES: hypothetical protein [unclassified Psychrobacter]
MSADYFNVYFGRYAAIMVQVNSVSVIATLLVFWIVYMHHITKPHSSFAIKKPNSHPHITYI